MATNKLLLCERDQEYETLEAWQSEHRREQKLDNAGFRGDDEIVVLGLEETEDELHWGQIEIGWRHRRRGIPISMCTPDEARRARENDIDDVTRPEWNDEH